VITRVASITLEVPDLDASVEFYESQVGLTLTERVGGRAYLRAGTNHHDLVLVQSAQDRSVLRTLNFEVSGDDLEADVARAVDAGASDLGPVDQPGVGRAHLVELPGGFGVLLHTGLHQVEAAPTSDLPRPMHFSHFNLGVPEPAPVIDLFVKAFGLEPSDWIGDPSDPLIGWLHCPVPGALHHGVAILTSDVVKLHHISYEYDSIDEVADRVDNYVDAEHYLIWGMGRHGTGGSIFAYIEDPSSLMVELGTGMIRIGQDPRWNGPEIWSLDDQRGVDAWGSAIPERWMGMRVDILPPSAAPVEQ
jgi:catechol 2,3-dioxygenase-like lactoylglutathione lyase family enzyme